MIKEDSSAGKLGHCIDGWDNVCIRKSMPCPMQLKSFIMCFSISLPSLIQLKRFIMCFNFNAKTNATKKIHHVFGLAVRVAISGEPWYTLVIYLSLCLFCCRIPIDMGQPPSLAKLYLFLFLFLFVFLHLKRVVLLARPVRLLQPGTWEQLEATPWNLNTTCWWSHLWKITTNLKKNKHREGRRKVLKNWCCRKYLFGLTSQDLESRKKVKHTHGVVKGSLIWELSCIFLKEKKLNWSGTISFIFCTSTFNKPTKFGSHKNAKIWEQQKVSCFVYLFDIFCYKRDNKMNIQQFWNICTYLYPSDISDKLDKYSHTNETLSWS